MREFEGNARANREREQGKRLIPPPGLRNRGSKLLIRAPDFHAAHLPASKIRSNKDQVRAPKQKRILRAICMQVDMKYTN